ncbi:MAG: hypothetical protein ACE14M_10105 [Terriglobales bacterium]
MNARRRRILLLHHDEQVLMNLEHILENRGFDTTTTWDSAEALRIMGARPFDLLLVGDDSPAVNAGEMLRQMQYSRINAPCIVLRSKPDRFAEDYLYSLGALDVMTGWVEQDVAKRLEQHFAARTRAATAG